MLALLLLILGALPAILLGMAGIFQKFSTNGGIGTGPFLIGVGITTVIVGSVFLLIEKQTAVSLQSGGFTVLFGLFWAISTGFVAISLSRYGAQISQLVPLYNMNTLVAVILGLALDLGQTEKIGDGAKFTALVNLNGVIKAQDDANAEHVIAALQAAFEDKHTAGVILRINSPGGSPVQSGIINDAVAGEQ